MTLVASPDPQTECVAQIEAARAQLFSGQPQLARQRLEALLEPMAGDPLPVYWLAAACGAMGDHESFQTWLRHAQTMHAAQVIAAHGGDLSRLQTDPAYAEQVGMIFYSQHSVGVASLAFNLAATGLDNPSRLLNLGLSLQHQGRIDEALDAFNLACELAPGNPAVEGFRLYALFFAHDGVKRHAAAAIEACRIYDAVIQRPAAAFSNPALAGRRLRVGFVAPDIGGTQLRQFIGPVFEHYDRSTMEVFHYAPAEQTSPYEGVTVRAIGGLSDDEATELIRGDRIDVLVDLWGHTANGRLSVFARRAAPVQVSWMNYVQTTGLRQMDYLIHPDCLKVPGAQEVCTEEIWYVGAEMGPFRPDPRPEPTPTPALANGHITFGSYTHPVRLSDATIEGWARILLSVPNSRLVLRYSYYEDEILKNTILMRFAARGVTPGRIVFRGKVGQPDYYLSYAEIDLALDPAPCPAGTTSLDALANGVPVLTLAGEDYYSRIGLANSSPMGLHELAVESWDDYVQRAIDLTADPVALDNLRKRVRSVFDASGRRDEAGFARRLERHLGEMFTLWRQRHHPSAAA